MMKLMNRSLFIVFIFLILFAALPAVGAESSSSGATPHKLTDTLQAGVKSVLNERTAEGMRIGAIVRLYNRGSTAVPVPEYEVRVTSSEGTHYTLKPSAANVRVVQPRETVELSYMLTVKRSDTFSLSKLSWVSVDEFVYPMKETEMVTVPVSSLEWKGNTTKLTGNKLVAWEDSFKLPIGSSSLTYKPVQMLRQGTSEGASSVVTIEVSNAGKTVEWVPAFTLIGKAGSRDVIAVRAEGGEIAVLPGEARSLHFVLPVEADQEPWDRLTVATPESFTDANGTVTTYHTGWLQINVPAGASAVSFRPTRYTVGNPISFLRSSMLANSDITISLVEMQRFEQTGDGYQTGVVKFRVTNKGDTTIGMPAFGAEWETTKGARYKGVRQITSWQTLLPGMGYVVSYAFTLPSSELGDRAVVHLLEGDEGAFQYPVASLSASLPETLSHSQASLFPFTITINRWALKSQMEPNQGLKYSYSLEVDALIEREPDTLVDTNSTRLKAELIDAQGNILGSQYIPLIGTGRLIDGVQWIKFDGVLTESLLRSATVHLYEVFDTPEGEVARLVKVLK